MMIMSGHIVEYNDLKYRNDDECILSQRHNFIHVWKEGGKNMYREVWEQVV